MHKKELVTITCFPSYLRPSWILSPTIKWSLWTPYWLDLLPSSKSSPGHSCTPIPSPTLPTPFQPFVYPWTPTLPFGPPPFITLRDVLLYCYACIHLRRIVNNRETWICIQGASLHLLCKGHWTLCYSKITFFI